MIKSIRSCEDIYVRDWFGIPNLIVNYDILVISSQDNNGIWMVSFLNHSKSYKEVIPLNLKVDSYCSILWHNILKRFYLFFCLKRISGSCEFSKDARNDLMAVQISIDTE